MPTVSRYGGRKIGLDALPGVRKSAGETPQSQGAGLEEAKGQAARLTGRAKQQTAEAMAGFGEQVAQIGVNLYTQAQARQSDADLLDFDRQTADWENANLHDAQTGVLNTVHGKDALDLPDKVGTAFDVFTGPLLEKMNARDRAAAENLTHRRRAQITRTLELYGGKELDAYETAVYNTSLDSSIKLGIANAHVDVRLAEELQKQTVIITKRAAHTGMPTEVRDAQIAAARTATHVGVIKQYLAEGDDKRAAWYFDEVKDQITGDQRAALTAQLESASTAGEGLRASEAIWQAHGPKSDGDPIALDTMETAARTKFKDDPKALDATIRYLRERKSGLDAARQDRKEATAGTLWKAVNEGATLEQIRTLPEYVNAPGALQLQVSEKIVEAAEQRANRVYTAGQRNEAAERLRESKKERAGWAMLWHYDSPGILSQMTDNQVLALTPDLGVDHVNRLMTKKRAITKSDDTVRAATIDDDLFKTTAQTAGFDAYSPKTDDERSTLGQLRNVVETEIDHAQQRAGKAIGREEKQKIMRDIVDRKVMLDVWGTDPARVAATVVNVKDRKRAYVPAEKIPPPVFAEYLNYARGLSPALQAMPDSELRTRFESRIQRAYGLRLIGGSRAEIEAAMRGEE
jgi:hypothetical protein